jgi:uncharacterized protein YlxW (UPF0749 family)
MSRPPRPASGTTPPSPPPGLLAQLIDNPLDQDYLTAAAHRGSTPRAHSRTGSLRLVAGVAVFGVLLGVSAVKTARDQPQAQLERSQLIDQIQAHQARLDRLHASLRSLQLHIADLQTATASQADAEARLSSLESTLAVVSGTAPVVGPGLVVTAYDAPDATAGAGGTIVDSDLQALVNGLWAAGAEAIALNGHRLTSLTAIRSAGQAITVDYRSLSPPYVVSAIGDPDTLPARFLQSQGGQVWLGLRANFGIRFQTRTEDRLELPGQTHAALVWAHDVAR